MNESCSISVHLSIICMPVTQNINSVLKVEQQKHESCTYLN